MSPRQQKSQADAVRWFKDKKRDLQLEIRAYNDFIVARDATFAREYVLGSVAE